MPITSTETRTRAVPENSPVVAGSSVVTNSPENRNRDVTGNSPMVADSPAIANSPEARTPAVTGNSPVVADSLVTGSPAVPDNSRVVTDSPVDTNRPDVLGNSPVVSNSPVMRTCAVTQNSPVARSTIVNSPETAGWPVTDIGFGRRYRHRGLFGLSSAFQRRLLHSSSPSTASVMTNTPEHARILVQATNQPACISFTEHPDLTVRPVARLFRGHPDLTVRPSTVVLNNRSPPQSTTCTIAPRAGLPPLPSETGAATTALDSGAVTLSPQLMLLMLP